MACYHPIPAWRSPGGEVVFSQVKGLIGTDFKVPCGQCIGCRLDRSRMWAARCMHEASLHDDNCFITLTYNDKNMPENATLVKNDFTLFMKRLRKRYGSGIRFYMCGEYGSKTMRPHYHAIIFGHDFTDKRLFSVRDDVRLYVSDELQKLWPFGFSTIGNVTFESAAYVARYIMKKVTGLPAEEHYAGRLPEYNNMSRRPGIGREWYEKYKGDVFPHDFMVIRDGIKCKPPRYYASLYEIDDPEGYLEMMEKRKEKGRELKEESTPERLAVREEVTKRRLERLVRDEI